MSSIQEPRAKLYRARDHLDLLYAELRAFLKREPYTVSVERNANQLPVAFRMNITEHPPKSWGLMLGDYVHNLRSSLDHLVWELSLDNCTEPGREVEFPIYEIKPKSPETIRGKIKCVDPKAQGVIEALQPYHQGDKARYHKLGTLNVLDIIDKHRRLNIVAYKMIMTWRVGGEAFRVPAIGDNFYDGQLIQILEPRGVPPDVEVDVKAEPSLAVIIDYEGFAGTLEIFPTPNLSDLYGWVKERVFDGLAPYFTEGTGAHSSFDDSTQ